MPFSLHSHVDNLVYFWYSLAFITAKALMAMLAAASITVCSVKIRLAIQLVSSASWNPEAESFSKYLNDDPTYFDGFGFFFLTRQLVLGVSVLGKSYIKYSLFFYSDGSIGCYLWNLPKGTRGCNSSKHWIYL